MGSNSYQKYSKKGQKTIPTDLSNINVHSKFKSNPRRMSMAALEIYGGTSHRYIRMRIYIDKHMF